MCLKLGDLVQLVRGHLSKIQRAVLSALIVIEVHAKDVVAKLVEQEVSSINAFEWISQLRLSVFSFVLYFYFCFLLLWRCPLYDSAILWVQNECHIDLVLFVDITGQKRTCTSTQWMQSFCMDMSTLVTLGVWSSPHSPTGSVKSNAHPLLSWLSYTLLNSTTSSLCQMLPDPNRSSTPEVWRSSCRSSRDGKDRNH